MQTLSVPPALLVAAEFARVLAFAGAVVIGFVLRYVPMRLFVLAFGLAIGVDWFRESLAPVFADPNASAAALSEADKSDVAALLLGLLLPACMTWVVFVEPFADDDHRWDLHVYAWLFLWLVAYAFLVRPYPSAGWTHDDGLAMALAILSNAVLVPMVGAFVAWVRRRRSPRVEHFAGFGILLSHVGMCAGPYSLFSPNPYGLHEAYAVSLYGLAFGVVVVGEVLWLRKRWKRSSSRA